MALKVLLVIANSWLPKKNEPNSFQFLLACFQLSQKIFFYQQLKAIVLDFTEENKNIHIFLNCIFKL